MLLLRTIFLVLVLTITISSNTSYGNWKNKLKTFKTKTKDKITEQIQEKSQCPRSWQYFAASCYWKFPIRHSWSEARNECARFRADLVVIDSDNEFDYIAKNITDLREDFYVGFHYYNDSWSWINGRTLSDYTYYTEEDLCEDRLPIEPRHRSCGILDRARRGRLCMNVDVCDRKLSFICEKVVDRCSSLNDICGKHGRCINTDDGQYRCECHFLFGGNRCRSISHEGSQIIMVAIFIFAACITPIIFRSIYRILKRKLNRSSSSSTIYGKLHSLNNSEHGLPKQKCNHQEKKFDNFLTFLYNIEFSNFCNSSTFILIFSTFLLTIFCLLTIPFIQYRLSYLSLLNNSNITLTYKLNLTYHHLHHCRKFDNYIWQNFVSLPLALIITLICSCLKKRDTFCLQFCHGRPSLPMPLNLFDKRQRHVIAAIFGISANEVLKILEEFLIYFNTKYLTNNEGIIIELLKRIGIVLLIGMRYFPLLVSINTAHPISYALGLLYTFVDGTYTLIYTSYCLRFSLFRFDRTLLLQSSSSSSSNDMFQSDLIYVLLRNLPHFTLISFIFMKFFYLLIQQLKCRCCQTSTIITNHNKNDKNHQISFVSSILSIDLLIPDYQTKPEFYYTQGDDIDFSASTSIGLRWNTIGSTVAGTGVGGSSDSNRLYNPSDIVLDSSNALYIADQSNNRVVKWIVGELTGTTVAGQASGTAGSAAYELNQPGDIFVDSSNQLYVADTNNHRVQLWSSGAFTGKTVAGNGASGWTLIAGYVGSSGSTSMTLLYPTDAIFDPMGNIYVADRNNERIQFFRASQPNGTTIAGATQSSDNDCQAKQLLSIHDISSTIYIFNFKIRTKFIKIDQTGKQLIRVNYFLQQIYNSAQMDFNCHSLIVENKVLFTKNPSSNEEFSRTEVKNKKTTIVA
ncbi:unnamed protein product [Rotaria sordida]|uniref:Uncharacterized protein n=2 Tax=Rotaria sordida TaxID=392033 RepID=A0A814XD50_9BILA|nr:unnamed protein product [Rotaria sordida]